MSDTAIRFDRVSKRYRLRHGGQLARLREGARRLARRAVLGGEAPRDEFWALRDVSFEIERGETVGLIGANGAGKSTLLKILSRVTVPTSGSFHANGKLSALIEIGAGFHPDLTGRENVYLNGAIMGMRRAEVEAKFDRIVAFAEVERFIDTPLKRYSSGMEVRLGFAVAAHVDPDILLVDEVLAVGDAAFQAKCLNKLAELKEQAKTIVLVSHNMANIVQESDRVIWLERGRIRAFGEPEAVVEQYLETVTMQHDPLGAPHRTPEDGPIRIAGVSVRDARGNASSALAYGQAAAVDIACELRARTEDPVVSVTFHDMHGHPLGALTTRLDGVKIDPSQSGTVRLVLSPVLFTRGTYTLTVAVLDARLQRYLDLRPAAASFTVDGPSVASREVGGHVVYPHRWEHGDGG